MNTQSEKSPPSLLLRGVILLLLAVLAASLWKWLAPPGPDRSGPIGGTPKTWTTQEKEKIAEIHRSIEHYILSNQLAKARLILLSHQETYPGDPKGPYLMAKLLVAEANALTIQGHPAAGQARLADALGNLELAVRGDPDRPETHFELASLAQQFRQTDLALKHYRKAIELAPTEARYPMYLGSLLIGMDQIEEARQVLVQALRLDTTMADAHAMLGEIASRSGEFDQALEHVNKALELAGADEPKRMGFITQKAQILCLHGQSEAALRALMELEPRLQQKEKVVELFAEAYLALGRPGHAAARWAELAALEPHNALAAAEAGLCLFKAGDVEHAKSYLKQAADLRPNHPKVKELEKALSSVKME